MRPIPAEKSLAGFLAILALAFAALLVFASQRDRWLLEPAAGILALAGAVTLAAGLAMGEPKSRPLRIAALLLFVGCALWECAEPYGDHVGRLLTLGRLDDAFILLAVPAMLHWSDRIDPLTRGLRRMIWLGFGLQLAGFALDLGGKRLVARFGVTGDLWATLDEFLPFLAMELYLLAALGFIRSLRWRRVSQVSTPNQVGDLGRFLFAKARLFRRLHSPRASWIVLPGGNALFYFGMFCLFFSMLGPALRRRFGIGLLRQAREILLIMARHGLDAQSYYMFELYRPRALRQAGGYLTRYETKNGLFSAINRLIPGRRAALGDKLAFWRLCQDHRLPAIPVFAVTAEGCLFFLSELWRAYPGDFFLKPRHGKGAKRSIRYRRLGDDRYRSVTGADLTLSGVLRDVEARAQEEAMIMQPGLTNHPVIQDLAAQSLVAVRVMTCLEASGRPLVTHAMLRILGKLEPDWRTDIEFAAAIDLASGELGQLTGDKMKVAFEWLDAHPITGARVKGRVVPCWEEVKSLTLAAHRACRGRRIIGWDVAVTAEGPVLIEANSFPDVEFLQRVHRQPIGLSPLAKPLHDALIALERRR